MRPSWRVFDTDRGRGHRDQGRLAFFAARHGHLALLLHHHSRERDGTSRLYAKDPETLLEALRILEVVPELHGARATARSWALPAWATERALAIARGEVLPILPAIKPETE